MSIVMGMYEVERAKKEDEQLFKEPLINYMGVLLCVARDLKLESKHVYLE